MDGRAFHLVGYSFGGSLCVSFARYFHYRLRSLTLIAPGGLIRPHHLDWKGKLLYKSRLIPRALLRPLVKHRLRVRDETPAPIVTGGATNSEPRRVVGTSDVTGGDFFDLAPISRFRPHVTVRSVMAWQIEHHKGFIDAFTSSMADGPIYGVQPDWCALGSILASNARKSSEVKGRYAGLSKVLVVLGADDPVIVNEEFSVDVKAALGENGVQFAVLPGGHEVSFTKSEEVAETICEFWGRLQMP